MGIECGGAVRRARSDTPYFVVGATVEQLRAALDTLGPLRGGRRFAAFTDWEVAWRYGHREEGGQRRIHAVTVDVSVRFTVPRWTPPRSAAPELVASWRAFLGAVELHEQGHAEIAAAAGSEVQRRLLTLPAFASKEALDEAAEAAAREALREAREREATYDVETGHGERQGARLRIEHQHDASVAPPP